MEQSFERIETKFTATPEAGDVSSILTCPSDAKALVVLGHGASSDMRNAMLEKIAERMAAAGLASFRYNFPYSENGRGRDSQPVCLATVRSAVAAARSLVPGLPLLAGGHSFGGRMTSTAASESPLEEVSGFVFLGFPLHPPGQPETKRAPHLEKVLLPMLFLTGTRDALANLKLMQPVCKNLGPRATLHLLDTADHGFRILKRSRQNSQDVFDEIALTVRNWAVANFRISQTAPEFCQTPPDR